MKNERERNHPGAVVGKAIEMLRAWAEHNPQEYDPTDAIDDIASVFSIDESLRDPIRAHLWDEWPLIEGERRLIDDFEDDLP